MNAATHCQGAPFITGDLRREVEADEFLRAEVDFVLRVERARYSHREQQAERLSGVHRSGPPLEPFHALSAEQVVGKARKNIADRDAFLRTPPGRFHSAMASARAWGGWARQAAAGVDQDAQSGMDARSRGLEFNAGSAAAACDMLEQHALRFEEIGRFLREAVDEARAALEAAAPMADAA